MKAPRLKLKSRRAGLFVVRRRRDGRWWDGRDLKTKRDRWQREIGSACMFTRRAVATKIASKVGGEVLELGLLELDVGGRSS